jgi:hypothetical protein
MYQKLGTQTTHHSPKAQGILINVIQFPFLLVGSSFDDAFVVVITNYSESINRIAVIMYSAMHF